jgi:hypothetical protein
VEARAKKRSERKAQILLYLKIETEKFKHTNRSAVKLAKALNLRPSAHFRAIANELVEEGKLVSFDIPCKGAVPYRRYYMLPPNNRGRPKRPREIIVYKNGKPAGVMRLPGFPEND